MSELDDKNLNDDEKKIDDIFTRAYESTSSSQRKVKPSASRPPIASSSFRPASEKRPVNAAAAGKPMPRRIETKDEVLTRSNQEQGKPSISSEQTGRRVIFDSGDKSDSASATTPTRIISKTSPADLSSTDKKPVKSVDTKKPAAPTLFDKDKEKTAKKREDELRQEKTINTVSIVLFALAAILLIVSTVYMFIGRNRDRVSELTDTDTGPKQTALYEFKSPLTIKKTYKTKFPEGIQEKYKDLYAQNNDFVGWLSVPNTCIDTPVYKTDNDTYYLKHDNFDEYTKYGVPFLDEYCGVENLSRNSTIYGHNFDNKLIFDEIHNYEHADFYKKSPVITFNTLYRDYKWKVIASFRTNGADTGDNGYLFYYIAANMSDNCFMQFYDELMQRSYIQTQNCVDIQPTDKLLTLSTCTYFFDRNGSLENARFVLVARLVRDGEDESVDTSGVTENNNVRYPQLYYDVFGGENPYKNASRWEPDG